MSELFKLIGENFSEKDRELQWTYSCSFEFIFNKKKIEKITITDHVWKKPGRENITKELILDILEKELNNRRAKATNYQGNRKVYVREKVYYKGQKYWLIFWFKDSTDDHLWIRNCHRKDWKNQLKFQN